MGGDSSGDEGPSLQLEGRSSFDRAWYDCEVVQRGSSLFMHFDGYPSDEDEPLHSIDAIRFSSLAAEAADCPKLVPGLRVTGFKKSASEAVWVDAEIIGKKAAKHPKDKCHCSFTVRWLDTKDQGATAQLQINELCSLDERSIAEHLPQYQHFESVLERRQQAQQARGGGAAAGVAGGGQAGGRRPATTAAQRRERRLTAGGQQQRQGAEGGSDSEAEPEVISISDSEEVNASEEEDEEQQQQRGGGRRRAQGGAQPPRHQQQQQQEDAAPPTEQRRHVLRPPAGASGPPCALCQLAVLLPDDPVDEEECDAQERLEFGGVYYKEWVVHKRCAAYNPDQALSFVGQSDVGSKVPGAFQQSFVPAIKATLLKKCATCGLGGATAKCCASSPGGCKKYFHLHCAAACKVKPSSRELLCPAHALLSHVPAVKPGAFYSRPGAARQAELDSLRAGKAKPSGRLGGLSGGSRLGVTRLVGLSGSSSRLVGSGSGLAGSKRGGQEGQRGGQEGQPRRSRRNADKRVRYDQDHFMEAWQKEMLARARGDASASDAGSEDGSESMDEDGDEGEAGIRYADDSEDSGSDDEADEFIVGNGRQRRAALRGRAARQTEAARRSSRERNKVKSYAEEQEELELKMEAYRAEQAQRNGYEDTACEVCASKSRAKEMLLCDGCDRGFHLYCLDPPRTTAPLAAWYCPTCLAEQTCETCGQAVAGKQGRHRRQAKDLAYCSTCGGLCHAGCMQEQEEGELRCTLCLEGLQNVESILGCRTPEGREAAPEYYCKFKGKSYRRCRWVTERAAARMAPSQLQRFLRDSRGAQSVEPNVQEQWLQVERIVARGRDADTGQLTVLVKWRGLDYDKATWEPAVDMESEKEALQQFERRMALRVERDARAEERARQQELAPLAQQPGFVDAAGTLKDYQLEGINWMLGKLRGNMGAILGDEMGLGKTIQTAVFLQVARSLGLTTGPVAVVVPLSTYGSWEREMAKWAPGLEVLSYSGHQESRAMIRKYELGSEEDDMDAVRRKATALTPRFHVMLTTYDVCLRDAAVLRRFDWSGLVIDEGHSLKGQDSLRGQKLRELGAPWRLLLTGTPLQNNLRELLALLAFMADTTITRIEERVKRLPDPNPAAPGSAGGAEEEDEELAQAQAYIRKLHAYLEPRMLRRMKAVCLAGQMPPKITRRVACSMPPLQFTLYNEILAKEWDKINAMVRNRLERKSMNNVLVRLRQACNHPYLLPGQEPEEYKDPESSHVAEQGWRLMVAASGKLTLLQQLLPRLLARGHRVLIFSQFVEMLDILEDFLHDFQDTSGLLPRAEEDPSRVPSASAQDSGELESGEQDGMEEPHTHDEEEEFTRGRRGSVIRYFRLDGTTKSWQRQAMMDSFNSEECRVKVFLISTRAGSLGINLQSADTVILYDPDFNPFVDAQAEGRAHRLGQESTVMVYQLFTKDCVEERILHLAARKRKLEELVTRHLGRGGGVTDEDIKSSVFHGWGNLMRTQEEQREAGGVQLLSEAELEQLLDRSHVFADDLASGADAATLLGEVRAGNAAHMTFDAKAEEEGPAEPEPAVDRAMEAAMIRLLEERAAKYAADQAAKQELGRGRRSRGVSLNYAEGGDDGLNELLGDDSPDKEPEGKKGGKGKRKAAARGEEEEDDDDEYDPTRSPGVHGENAEPNAYTSDSGSDDDSVVVVEAEPKHRQGKAATAAGASGRPAAGAPPQPLATAASDFVGRLSIVQLQAMQKLSQMLQSGGRLQPEQVESLTSQLTPEQLRQMLDVAAQLKQQPQQAQQAQQQEQPSVLLQQAAAPPAAQQAQQAQQRQLTPLELQQHQYQQAQQQAAQQPAQQQPLQVLVQQLYAQREAALAQHAAQQQSQRAQQWLQQQLAREFQSAKQEQQQQERKG